MRFKKLAFTALVASAALALSACGGGAGATVDSENKIRVGIKFDQPGLGLKVGKTYTGFDVDVATYVAKELGYAATDIEWVHSPSANQATLLSNGQVEFIVGSYSITDERKKTVAFAGPYFIAGQDILVPVDSPVKGPEDLNGLNLCSTTGSTSAKRIKDNYAGNVNLLEQAGTAECVAAMQGGNIDAVTTDNLILAGLASDPAYEGKFRLVGTTFTEERYGIGLPLENTRCEAINTALGKMISDGSWQKFLDNNLEGIDFIPDAEKNPPKQDSCA